VGLPSCDPGGGEDDANWIMESRSSVGRLSKCRRGLCSSRWYDEGDTACDIFR